MRIEQPGTEQKASAPVNPNAPTFLMDEGKQWDSLTTRQRVRYLWDYYKLPFVIAFIVIYAIGFVTYRHFTHKDTVLFAGLINVAPNEQTTQLLSDDYLDYTGRNTKKEDFRLYTGWYLTTDKDSEYFEYTYASQIKILAAIDDEQLDIVIMDRESFDAFSQNGYLYDLDAFLKDSDLYEMLKPYFITNIEFLEDNAKEINFDASIEFEATSVEYPMGLDLTASAAFSGQEYSDTIYLGVIANTPRSEEALSYLRYLYSDSES